MQLTRLVLPAALLVVVSAAMAEPITVAGWNIAAYSHRVTPAIEANIARGIALLDADVIGLAEVASAPSLSAIVADLEANHGSHYQARFCPQSPNLNLAVLVREDIEAGPALLVPGTDLNQPRHRKACALSVNAGRFDFVLVTVHLKSGWRGRGVRLKQTHAIAAFLAGATLHGERDVILVGDYNMFPRRDAKAFAALSPTGSLRFLSTEGLCDDNERKCAPTYIDRGRLRKTLDGFAIARGDVREYVEGSFALVALHDLMGMTPPEFARRVSDHLPLRAEFDTFGPDDDG